MKEEFIQSKDLKFYTISNIVSETGITILWVHGFAEHCARYSETINFFASKGINSVAFDLRGHGKSGGTRAYIESFQDYLDDINSVRNYYEQLYPKTQWALVGHSMGGLITIRYHQTQNQHSWLKKVVSSPLLGIGAPVPGWKKFLSKIIVQIYPQFSIPSGLNPDHLSHDTKVCEDYKKDPLVLKNATAGWFENITKAMEEAFHDAAKTPEGLHFLVAGDDKLVDAAATEKFFQALPKEAHSTIKVYPGFYHEIFNEVNKMVAWNDLHELLQVKVLGYAQNISV